MLNTATQTRHCTILQRISWRCSTKERGRSLWGSKTDNSVMGTVLGLFIGVSIFGGRLTLALSFTKGLFKGADGLTYTTPQFRQAFGPKKQERYKYDQNQFRQT